MLAQCQGAGAERNSRNIGFTIPYKHDGEDKNYEPDFIVHLRNGVNLVTEIKGAGGKIFDPDAVPAKTAASKKWCEAVSNVGTFGKWEYAFCDAKDEVQLKKVLREKLATHGRGPVAAGGSRPRGGRPRFLTR